MGALLDQFGALGSVLRVVPWSAPKATLVMLQGVAMSLFVPWVELWPCILPQSSLLASLSITVLLLGMLAWVAGCRDVHVLV